MIIKHSYTKGQSMVAQFVIFFLIGIALFVAIGNFYKIQSEYLRENVLDLSVKMINSYIASTIVNSVEGCIECGSIQKNIELEKTYGGYFIEVGLNDSGLTVKTAPTAEERLSTINNLNEDLNIVEGLEASIKTINLTYTRNQNKLEIR